MKTNRLTSKRHRGDVWLHLMMGVAFAMVVPSSGQATHQAVYFIGNSLTGDAEPHGIEEMGEIWGAPLDVGYHVLFSSTLDQIFRHRNADRYLPSLGPYATALPANNWDDIVIQPHPRGGATLENDANAISYFVDLARTNPLNSASNIFIYESWPRSYEWDGWSLPHPKPVTFPATRTKDYHDRLLSLIQARFPQTNVSLVPVGEVWDSLRTQIDSKTLSSVRMADFYRDAAHASELGQFVASTTIFSALTGVDPRGMPVPNGPYYEVSIGDALAFTIQETVWEVLTTQSHRTGVQAFPTGDYNGNGLVEMGDLDLVLRYWGQTDLNWSKIGWGQEYPVGAIDQAELDGVLSNWGRKTKKQLDAGALFVPEPSANLLGIMLILCACMTRMHFIRLTE